MRLVGRFAAAGAGTISFSDDLASSVACAQAKLLRLLARIDAFAGFGCEGPRPAITPVNLSRKIPRSLSIRAENIRTIVWATGYRLDFSWLKVPAAISPDGELAHEDGATFVPGLYALGFRFLRKRDSHFIGGVGSDALAIAHEIGAFLAERSRWAA